MTRKAASKYPHHVVTVLRRRLGLDGDDPSLDQEIQAMPRRKAAEYLMQGPGQPSLHFVERIIINCGGTVTWPEEENQ